MDERYIAAIDLGTSKILLAVAKIEGDNFRLVFARETPTNDGIRYSRVANPVRVGEAIDYAVSLAEEELGFRPTQVVVNYPRYEVVLKDGCYSVARNEDECITADDIRNLRRLAMDKYADDPKRSEEEELFDAVAQSFNCGKEEFQILERNVIGMTTKELGANFKLFVGASKYVSDMDHAFRRAGNISVMRKYFAPEATAKAVLYDTEMENGVALIDLGAGITSVSIYVGGILRHYAAIPFGGRAVTMDIKSICAIPERLAENIKKAYGACMPDRLQNLGDKTLVIESDPALPSKHLSVQYLSEIITARETEIVNAVLYEIQESGLADLFSSVVLTGGGAEMTNISALFKELSGYSVRIGYLRGGFFSTGFDLGGGGVTAMGMLLMAREEYSEGYSVDASLEGEGDKEIIDESDEETVFTHSFDEDDEGNRKKSKKKAKADKGRKREEPKTGGSKGSGEETGDSGGWTIFTGLRSVLDDLSKEGA